MGCSVEEAELDDDEAEKVAAAWLVHLLPSVPPTAAGHGGAARAPNLAGIDGYGHREGDGEGYDVWEVSGDGMNLFGQEWWPFIGQRCGTGGLAWGSGARRSQVKGSGEGGNRRWSQTAGAHKACRRIRIRCGAVIQRGAAVTNSSVLRPGSGEGK
jgi:hypothetical protein